VYLAPAWFSFLAASLSAAIPIAVTFNVLALFMSTTLSPTTTASSAFAFSAFKAAVRCDGLGFTSETASREIMASKNCFRRKLLRMRSVDFLLLIVKMASFKFIFFNVFSISKTPERSEVSRAALSSCLCAIERTCF